MAAAKRKAHGQWIDQIVEAVEKGKYVRMETSEGVTRGGKLSGIRTRAIMFNGAPCDIPVELELNGDPTDTVPLHRLAKLSID
jgi:hypothetical protein